MVALIQVLIIAILIAVGYFLAKKGVFTTQTGKELSFLLINFVCPALLLTSFQIEYTPEKMKSLLTTFFLGMLSYAIVIPFSFLYCGKGERNKVERLSVIFSNVGFMGIPLIAGIYGTEGLFYASIMCITFNIMYWSYGAAAIRGKFSAESVKSILLSPAIIAVMIGLIFFIAKIRLVEPFASAAMHLGNLNTPLAMIISGITIAQSDLLSIFKNKKVYRILFGKLLLAPILVALVFLPIPVPTLIKEIVVLQTACPVAAIISIAILQCDGDSKSATDYFSLTTLASVLTIPVVKLICEILYR